MPEQLNTRSNNAVWGGVLLSITGNLHWQEMVQTIILAAVGTAVSFGTSALLKQLSAKKRNAPNHVRLPPFQWRAAFFFSAMSQCAAVAAFGLMKDYYLLSIFMLN